MVRPVKKETLNIRLTAEQRRKLERAALIASKDKGEIVAPSTLFREFGMSGVEKVLSLMAEAERAA